MKHLPLITTAAIIISLFSCSKDAENNTGSADKKSADTVAYTIEGVVKNKPYIYLLEMNGTDLMPVDSTQANEDGSFKFSGKIKEPGFYFIDFYGFQRELVVLEQGTAKVEAHGLIEGGYFKYEAGENQQWFNKVEKLRVAKDLAQEELNRKYRLASTVQQEKDFYRESMASDDYYRAIAKKMIDSMGTSFVALYATNFFNRPTDLPYLDSLAKKFKKVKASSKYVKEFIKTLNERGLGTGAAAPALSGKSPDDKQLSLTDLKGKYVLVDFWAAWCPDCREENPKLKAFYEANKSPKFEVFGVSLDTDKNKWLSGIEKDGLTWPQISELKKWDASAASVWQVNEIPTTFLVDPNGKIIGRNLSYEQIAQIIKN